MAEVAGAGKDHGQTMFIGGGDGFLVGHRSAVPEDRLGTGRSQQIRTNSRREEHYI